MTSYLDNGYDLMKYFAKFEKFIPHSIPSFITVGSQMPELDSEAFLPPPPPYKIGCQNTPYKLGLSLLKILRHVADCYLICLLNRKI